MALTHTPACTTDHPERFEDEETGLGYDVRQDIDADDPRGWIKDEHAALWAYREPRIGGGSVAADRPDHWIIDAFAEFYELTGEDDLALETTKRWLRIFHPGDTHDIATQTIRGYSQGDWLDVIAVVAEGYGTAESHINTFRMWAFGDVWTVTPDHGDSLSGIYADDAEEAVAYFRENHEGEDEADEQPTEEPELDPLEKSVLGTEEYRIAWEIDQSGHSPAKAAVRVWRETFRRGPFQPSAEDACVFTVSDGDRSIEIDLSEERYAHLFEN